MDGNPNDTDKGYDDDEVTLRRDDALRRALNTPPQPKPTSNPKAVKPAAPASAKKRGRPAGAS